MAQVPQSYSSSSFRIEEAEGSGGFGDTCLHTLAGTGLWLGHLIECF